MPTKGAASGSRRRARRRRRRRGAGLVVLLCLGALLWLAASGGPAPQAKLALTYARAWSKQRWSVLYRAVGGAAATHRSEAVMARSFKHAWVVATAVSAKSANGVAAVGEGRYAVAVTVKTKLFGTLHERFVLPIANSPDGPYVRFNPSLLFPGVPPGATLSRATYLPPRAPIYARDGTPLAAGERSPSLGEGPRPSPLGAVAEAVSGSVGELGTVAAPRREALEAEGVPREAMVGTSGLELYYDKALRGTPGGTLYGGRKVLARARAVPGTPVYTTIAPAVERAALEGLGGRLGGVVALDPASGEVLALAGLGADDVQPPGSTFKLVTASAVLEDHLASLQTTFPVNTETVVEGVKIENAGGEACGGTLLEAFAVSCNSVFIPLGIKVGPTRLVAMAERFGFNHTPPLPGAVPSTIPPPSQFRGEVETGVSAIGQGRVEASPLQMALVAATIAHGGLQPTPTLLLHQPPLPQKEVLRPQTAAALGTLMRAVVTIGIGGAAAIPGVEVAGKTGTAELGENPCGGAPEGGGAAERGAERCRAAERANTDAWFAAFAPLHHPKVAVAVLVVKDGYGGETAAPVARQVIEAALGG